MNEKWNEYEKVWMGPRDRGHGGNGRKRSGNLVQRRVGDGSARRRGDVDPARFGLTRLVRRKYDNIGVTN